MKTHHLAVVISARSSGRFRVVHAVVCCSHWRFFCNWVVSSGVRKVKIGQIASLRDGSSPSDALLTLS